MERQTNFSAITSYDLLTDDSFVQWLVYPDDRLDRYWTFIQQRYPQTVDLITRIRFMASQLVVSEPADRMVLQPCG